MTGISPEQVTQTVSKITAIFQKFIWDMMVITSVTPFWPPRTTLAYSVRVLTQLEVPIREDCCVPSWRLLFIFFYHGLQEEQHRHEFRTLTDVDGQITRAARAPPSAQQLKVLWNLFWMPSSSLLALIRSKEGPRLWSNMNLRLVYIFKNIQTYGFEVTKG